MIEAKQLVEYKYHYGSDKDIVNAARVSFAKEIETFEDKDAKLIRYLATHNHWTPFGHAGATFRFKAPIFVARQLVKHQVGLVWNEVSRRYVDSEPEFYFPDTWRGRPTGGAKQGSTGTVDNQEAWQAYARRICENGLEAYDFAIKEGVAPEQARMLLPLNHMTEWIWSGTLMAWARVYKLRIDPHSQLETREIVSQIAPYLERCFPVSWNALI